MVTLSLKVQMQNIIISETIIRIIGDLYDLDERFNSKILNILKKSLSFFIKNSILSPKATAQNVINFRNFALAQSFG